MPVAFFIVAHSDDWFLFMGNAGAEAVADQGNTIVFVYVTAANFIDNTNVSTGTLTRLRYEWGLRVREDATIATALGMCGFGQNLPRYFPGVAAPNVAFDVKTINGREIAFYQIRNTRHYCLRLADGIVDGSGVAWNGNQSLKRLRENNVAMTAQGSIPAGYATWDELTATLRGIFDAESGGQHAWLNYLDAADADNPFPDGHSDHRHVALAVQDAIAGAANYDSALFRGYTIRNSPENLDPPKRQAKKALITSWDNVQKSFYPTIDHSPYTEWALRQYRV